MSIKSVAYIRVSSSDQTVEHQRMILTRESQKNDDTIGKFYEDSAVSGIKTRRAGLDALLSDARKNKFQRLYVYDLSRMSRSVKHLLEVVEILKDLNVDLVFVKEKIDTSSPTGRFFLTVIGSLYELEREMIRERSQIGIERARKAGVKFGRPKIVNDNLKSAVKVMREQGISIKKIAHECGISIGSVYACL